jgi:putative protease
MKWVAPLKKLEDQGYYASHSIQEVILSPQGLSRFGNLSIDQINHWSYKALEYSLRPLLQWDSLMTEEDFQKSLELWKKIDLSHFHGVRVQDAGAVHFCKARYPDKKIHLILENGNHNINSIKAWADFLGEQLERIVLSLELPQKVLIDYIEKLNQMGIESEILGLGKILLFYSPRKLLSPLVSSKQGIIEANASGEETAHKNFPVLENTLGTFMFNPKDYILIDQLEQLKLMGLSCLRLDIDFDQYLEVIRLIDQLDGKYDEKLIEKIKALYPRELFRPFFKSNRTDVLFKKLKNPNVLKHDGPYLGEVVDVIKKRLMGICLHHPTEGLKIGDQVQIKTPEGKIKYIQIKELKDSSQRNISLAKPKSIVFMSHVGGVSVKSRLFIHCDT